MQDGLFDFGGGLGGGGDLSDMLSRIFGVGQANAAGGQLTPEQLLQSNAAQNPVVPPPPPIEPPGSVANPNAVRSQSIAPTTSVTPQEAAAAPVFNDTSGLPPQRLGLERPQGNPDVMKPGAVGAALTAQPVEQGPTPSGEPLTRAPLAGGTSGSTDISAQSKSEQRPSLAQALRGAQMPKPPELQKIATPNAPRPTGQIKGGELVALLQALNAGTPQRQLPMTLGRG